MAAQGRIRLVEKHTDTDGMLDVARLDDLVDDVAERQTWACGPAGMLDALEQHWAEAGIADRLHTERFRATVVSAGEGGLVTFTKSDTTVDADGADTLLDAGEAAGVLMPSGCRMGICFGCVAPLRQGAVRDLRNRRNHHGRRRRRHPDLRVRRCGPLRHRSLNDLNVKESP